MILTLWSDSEINIEELAKGRKVEVFNAQHIAIHDLTQQQVFYLIRKAERTEHFTGYHLTPEYHNGVREG